MLTRLASSDGDRTIRSPPEGGDQSNRPCASAAAVRPSASTVIQSNVSVSSVMSSARVSRIECCRAPVPYATWTVAVAGNLGRVGVRPLNGRYGSRKPDRDCAPLQAVRHDICTARLPNPTCLRDGAFIG